MLRGKLLPRNEKIAIGTGEGDGWATPENTINPSVLDPLSPSFVVPDWLVEKPTPWNLAAYWAECLSNVFTGEETRTHVNGIRAELRPAKALLEKYGVAVAARMCKYWAEKLSCQITLHHVLRKAEEVLKDTSIGDYV